jgi:hypothetical protein
MPLWWPSRSVGPHLRQVAVAIGRTRRFVLISRFRPDDLSPQDAGAALATFEAADDPPMDQNSNPNSGGGRSVNLFSYRFCTRSGSGRASTAEHPEIPSRATPADNPAARQRNGVITENFVPSDGTLQVC